MTALVAAALGSLIGLGLVVAMGGVRGIVVLPDLGGTGGIRPRADRALGRATVAGGVGLAAGAATGWPVSIALGALGGWFVPVWWAGRGRHRGEVARVEAIAGWTEQLRDTLAAAHGLEHAIGATAHLAPAAISEPVARLAARVEYETLSVALRRFADDVDHPLADFVVAALVVAAEKEARELGPLLGQLAECAREDARMRSRIWVGRARTRTAVRIIVGVVALFVAGLLVLDREYLAPYDSSAGQLALLVIAGLFVGAFAAMERIGRLSVPERFVRRRVEVLR